MKKAVLRLFAFLFASLILFYNSPAVVVYAGFRINQQKLFGVISDNHLFSEGLIDTGSADFQAHTHMNMKLMGESEAIIKAALQTIAVRKAQGNYKMDYLLLPGDLTFNGEKPAHIKLAAMLRDFEERTGIQVFVINGNHDINNYSACSYTAVAGKKITASQSPDLLFTTPEKFRELYADFGYSQADSIYVPPSGKAGMLSYSVSLAGGYRLIAIDSCVYTSDLNGEPDRSSRMRITPDLLEWIKSECAAAETRGETVIGMSHGNVVEHYEYQAPVAKNSIMLEYEKVAYELADAGMHFIFTGHSHMNDTACIVSGNNEIIYDIETCGLTTYPNIYREAAFEKAAGSRSVNCRLSNTDCDANSNVDLSGISDIYKVIQKPFRENYSLPMLCGGSIEQQKPYDTAVFLERLIADKLPDIVDETFPEGIAGLLDKEGLDIARLITELSPEVTEVLMALNIPPAAFSQFIDSVIRQIDEKYIFDTAGTMALANSAIHRLAKFELAQGDKNSSLGEVIMVCMLGLIGGDESPGAYPGIAAAIRSLRTQAGADRLFEELLDIIISDMLFTGILASISLDELDSLLPADVMTKLRNAAGPDLTAAGVLDAVLNPVAKIMKNIEFVKVDNSRDVVKAVVYTAGYQYLNAESRLHISSTVADAIASVSQDNNPFGCSDSNVTLHYNGKVNIKPTVENYRLPNDISITAGGNPGEAVINWHTIYGIENSDIIMTPLPVNAVISVGLSEVVKEVPLLDFGFASLNKQRPLLSHTIQINGLQAGVLYRCRIGDKAKGCMSGVIFFTINNSGEIVQYGKNDFFTNLISFYQKAISLYNKIFAVFRLFP